MIDNTLLVLLVGAAASLFSCPFWLVWEVSVKEGYTIRGAVEWDIGPAFNRTYAMETLADRGAVEWDQIYWTPYETIGPAFNRTYAMETLADWSRVILGATLLRTIARLPAK
jgi:hypothetical protein